MKVAKGLDKPSAGPVFSLQADARVLAVVVRGEKAVGNVHGVARVLASDGSTFGERNQKKAAGRNQN